MHHRLRERIHRINQELNILVSNRLDAESRNQARVIRKELNLHVRRLRHEGETTIRSALAAYEARITKIYNSQGGVDYGTNTRPVKN